MSTSLLRRTISVTEPSGEREPQRRPVHRFVGAVISALVAASALGFSATASNAAAGTDSLNSGEMLDVGQSLVSNGTALVMQGDGNLVEIAPGNHPVWASNTGGNPGSILRMQSDGNAVIIAPGNRPIWATNTGGNHGSILRLQGDGNLVVIAPGNVAKWANGVRLDKLNRPVNGPITSRFGPRGGRNHDGIDFGVPVGTPVRAAADGRVTLRGWVNGYGNRVEVSHGALRGQSVSTTYSHLSYTHVVSQGQWVQRGQVIGYSGNTGNSTGPHLHFEVRANGWYTDPMNWL